MAKSDSNEFAHRQPESPNHNPVSFFDK